MYICTVYMYTSVFVCLMVNPATNGNVYIT